MQRGRSERCSSFSSSTPSPAFVLHTSLSRFMRCTSSRAARPTRPDEAANTSANTLKSPAFAKSTVWPITSLSRTFPFHPKPSITSWIVQSFARTRDCTFCKRKGSFLGWATTVPLPLLSFRCRRPPLFLSLSPQLPPPHLSPTMPALHQWDYLFAFSVRRRLVLASTARIPADLFSTLFSSQTIFAALDAFNIGVRPFSLLDVRVG